MTEPIDGQENQDEKKIEFSDEEQRFINKLMKQTKDKATEKADVAHKAELESAAEDAKLNTLAAEKKWRELAEHHEARVKELEGVEGKAKAYEEILESMLKDRVKNLSKEAKKLYESLPGDPTPTERLAWLDANAEALALEGTPESGTPARQKKVKPAGESSWQSDVRL